ncbi:hypothetical protein [Streptomyces hirsutus]|uniref:hypothetical protein n=1 Tax=Streptomyces hirsutus TaxID=35620 RepID=UPI00339FA6B4
MSQIPATRPSEPQRHPAVLWIYELPEPKELKDQTVEAKQYVVKYDDGPRDAESTVVHAKTGRVCIIGKQEDDGHLYEDPAALSTSGTNVFTHSTAVGLWATDAAFSPDEKQLTVRGHLGCLYYDWNDGKIARKGRISVPLGQGESGHLHRRRQEAAARHGGRDSTVKTQDAPGREGGESSSPGGSSAASSDNGDGDGPDGMTLKIGGAVAVLAVPAAVFGLRRVFRRQGFRRQA